MKIIHRIGDVNPLDYGGGVVFKLTNNTYQFEFTYGSESELSVADTKLDVWDERDRYWIALRVKETDAIIVELFDDDAKQLFEDGYLDSKNLHRSLHDYANELGLLDAYIPAVVYKCLVPDNVFSFYGQEYIVDIAAATGEPRSVVANWGKSKSIKHRATTLECICLYCGSDIIDEAPITYVREELEERWKLRQNKIT